MIKATGARPKMSAVLRARANPGTAKVIARARVNGVFGIHRFLVVDGAISLFDRETHKYTPKHEVTQQTESRIRALARKHIARMAIEKPPEPKPKRPIGTTHESHGVCYKVGAHGLTYKHTSRGWVRTSDKGIKL